MAKVACVAVRALLVGAMMLGGCSGLAGQGTSAKAPDPGITASSAHLSFDVVSIRESGEGNTSFYDNPPRSSYFHGQRIMAWGLVLSAYEVKIGSLLKGAPAWAMATRYDITAKGDAAADAALVEMSDQESYAAKRQMLRGVLADRFKLQIHSETRLSTTYELVATPRAAKLMVPVGDEVKGTVSSCNPHFSRRGTDVDAKGCPFTILLSLLEQMMGTTVLDRTGLKGKYAYDLRWSMSESPPGEGEDRYPVLVDAVRQQLGLELKETKGPVTIWVMDHIEKPTAN